jgi:hypothetical protein
MIAKCHGALPPLKTKLLPQVYVFMVPSNGSLVIVGSLSKKLVSRSSLVAAGKAMDRKCNYGFSFEAMAKQLREQEKE